MLEVVYLLVSVSVVRPQAFARWLHHRCAIIILLLASFRSAVPCFTLFYCEYVKVIQTLQYIAYGRLRLQQSSFNYFAPRWIQSIVLRICSSVSSHISKTTWPNFTKFLCVLPVALHARSYTVMALLAICYIQMSRMYFRFCRLRHVFTQWAPWCVMCVPKRRERITAENTASITTKFSTSIKISN